MVDRAKALMTSLSLEGKVGLLFHPAVSICPMDETSNTPWSCPTLREMLDANIRHFLLTGSIIDSVAFVTWHNEVQLYATTHGSRIPVVFSTDPRHSYTMNPMMSSKSGALSKWPESVGMVALADEQRMLEFSDIIRQEYLALGIRSCLHPQVDLATEYRWSRIAGGLGEDSDMAAKLCCAQIRGLQGDVLGKSSVAACVKHFPGGAPLKNGHDSHFQWGSEQIYPGGQFEYHLKPFRAAIGAGVRSVMPGYGKPMGIGYPEIGMAFNRAITQGLLRDECLFKGVVLSDFGLVAENEEGVAIIGEVARAKAWGVEHLSMEDRIIKLLDAGVDQLGGDHCTQALLKLVSEGKVSEARIDKSVLPILRNIIDLGIVDDCTVSPENAARIVGSPSFIAAGYRAQKDSITLIVNTVGKNGCATLPLSAGIKIYREGWTEAFPTSLGILVDTPQEADAAIIRLQTPYETIGEGLGAEYFHHGRLGFDIATLDHVTKLSQTCPVVVDIAVDRPPILGSLLDAASAIVFNYGLDVQALLDVLFALDGSAPHGKLPFDLPRSMEAVERSRSDVPYDTENPTFRRGHGLAYS